MMMKTLALVLVIQWCIVFAHFPPKYDFTKIFAQKQVKAGPSQVHVSYPGKDEMVVVWVSTANSDPSSVNYGTANSSLTNTVQGTVTSYSFQGYTSGGLHSAVLTGLQPSTVYYYRVGGPSQWSDIYSFKSAPPLGKEDIIIGAIGDVGADPNSEQTVKGLISVREQEGLDFILHAGDLSYANNYNPGGPVWDHYGDILEPLTAFTPYNPGVGNHESIDDFTAYRLRYDTSQLEKNSGGGNFYWSFDYGNVHVVHLSSESDYSASSPQYAWLKSDLSKVDRKVTPWVIGVWHRPWYSSNKAHEAEGEAMRKSLEPLFIQYNVDLALVGHVHAYERVAPIANNVVKDQATAYVTVGNGGTPEGLAKDWGTKPVWSQFRIAEWGYSRLRVYNATHAHWTMRGDADESVLDDFWFIRTR